MPFLVQGGAPPDNSVSTAKIQDNAVTLAKMASGTGGITQNTIAGLILSKTGADTLTIAAGSARDTGDAATMALAAFTKNVSASWAVGTGNGSLDTGSYAGDTSYAVWLIQRSGTAVVDVLTSTSFTGPTMPTSYDRKRLIGWFMTDGTPDINDFTQVGDVFILNGELVEQVINDSTITHETFETGTIPCPPSAIALLSCDAYDYSGSIATGMIYVKRKGSAGGANGPHEASWFGAFGGSTFDHAALTAWVPVDSASQIEYACQEQSASAFRASLRGCQMLTRSNPL